MVMTKGTEAPLDHVPSGASPLAGVGENRPTLTEAREYEKI